MTVYNPWMSTMINNDKRIPKALNRFKEKTAINKAKVVWRFKMGSASNFGLNSHTEKASAILSIFDMSKYI